MKFITFYAWHDASIAGFDGKNVKYLKIERETGLKHNSFFNGWPPSPPVGSNETIKTETAIKFIKHACNKWEFKPDAIAFCGFGYCKNENTLWEARSPIYGFDVPTYCIDHHYAHALSCWPVSNNAHYSVVIDGVGDYNITHRIIKNTTDPLSAKCIYHTKKPSFSALLKQIGIRMGLKGMNIDFAGKIMGAQSYGVSKIENFQKSIEHIDLIELLKEYKADGTFGDIEFNNWLATMHEIGISSIFNLFKDYCPKDKKITFSGGCAQNAILNERLFNFYGENFNVPPHCYDGGLTLGCLEFLRIIHNQKQFPLDNFPYWQDDNINETPSKSTIDEILNMLCDNKIVGWFQGRGEIGPRALGNRSILMNPSIKNGKDILNHQVKNRESWRPYAASILKNECEKWFDCSSSMFMLRAVKVNKSKADLIPSVCHIDGTCRIQTVTQESNPIFYDLINKFYNRTGIPMLLNTSLNNGGDPIFSNKQQCKKMLLETNIDCICFGNTILKRPKHI